MDATEALLIVGASARAAAFSALRAGFRPWCADLFADADLRRHAPVMRLPARYPDGFLDLLDGELRGPWMYTGGLENRPFLVRKMARRRPLWGNDQGALLAARSPFVVADLLRKARLPAPAVWGPGDRFTASARRWLVKPLAGSGGSGIHFLGDAATATVDPARCYLQEYLEGEPRAAVFVGDGRSAQLLGATRQLVGKPWLNAAPFHYCGSVGPLALTADETRALARLGSLLAAGCRLRGLFGIDGVWRNGALWPVEINPRYTASVEVIEYATELRALQWHAHVFEPKRSRDPAPFAPTSCIGKAILFARQSLDFPLDGPWAAGLTEPWHPEQLPSFADIPPTDTRIEAGKPILTIFARATTPAACEAALEQTAAAVESLLFAG